MISIYNLKPRFQELLAPTLKMLHKLDITANQITITSIILSFIIGLLFWFSGDIHIFFLALPIGLLLRMALNALDGMMARIYNQQSKKGELLNELGDIISDLFIYFPLLLFENKIIYLIVLFISLSIINEFTGLLGKVISGNRRYDGPMGKSDRAFLLGVYGILQYLSVNLSAYSVWIFSIVIFLLIISTVTRIKKSLI